MCTEVCPLSSVLQLHPQADTMGVQDCCLSGLQLTRFYLSHAINNKVIFTQNYVYFTTQICMLFLYAISVASYVIPMLLTFAFTSTRLGS